MNHIYETKNLILPSGYAHNVFVEIASPMDVVKFFLKDLRVREGGDLDGWKAFEAGLCKPKILTGLIFLYFTFLFHGFRN